MKICFFNTTKFWGGGEKWHFEVGSALNKKGHEVVFYTRKGSDLTRKLDLAGIKKIAAGIGKWSYLNPFRQLRIYRFFKTEQIDVVIFNGPLDLKLGAFCAKWAGVRQRIYRRGLAAPIKPSLLNKQFIKSGLTGIIANSKMTAQLISEKLPMENLPVYVIYNGLHDFSSKSQNSQNAKPVLGNLGRLDEQKGQGHLLDLANDLISQGLDFEIRIGGEGKLRKQLEKRIQTENLSEYVKLLGHVEDTENFLKSIDVFVFTSLWEGFGFAMAEAMLLKKPVIAFDLSSNPEVIPQSEIGRLVPHNDREALCKRVMELASDSELRLNLGESARKWVLGNFMFDAQIEKLEQILQKED